MQSERIVFMKRKKILDFSDLGIIKRRRTRKAPLMRLFEQLDANQRYRHHWAKNWSERP